MIVVGVSALTMLASCSSSTPPRAATPSTNISTCPPRAATTEILPLSGSGAARPTVASSDASAPTPLALDKRYDRAIITAGNCEHPGSVAIFEVRVARAVRGPDGTTPSNGEFEKATISIYAGLQPASYEAGDFTFVGLNKHRYNSIAIVATDDSSQSELTAGTVEPNTSVRGILYFDVPPGGGELEFNDSNDTAAEVWKIDS